MLLLATTTPLNHSRSYLIKVIALPTLGFSKPFSKSTRFYLEIQNEVWRTIYVEI